MKVLDFPKRRPAAPPTAKTLAIGDVTYVVTQAHGLVLLRKPDGVEYAVDANGCDCPSFLYRQTECKHQEALRAAGLLPGKGA